MSDHKYTPGPWYAREMRGWSGVCISRFREDVSTAGDAPIAQVREGYPHWENKFPVEANARLIAAAPELLEALEAVVACWNHHDVGKAYVEDLARAAIAKAKGETEKTLPVPPSPRQRERHRMKTIHAKMNGERP